MNIGSHQNGCTPLVTIAHLNGEGQSTCKASFLHIKTGGRHHSPFLCNKAAHPAQNWPDCHFQNYFITCVATEKKKESKNYALSNRIKELTQSACILLNYLSLRCAVNHMMLMERKTKSFGLGE